jgi:hypothetical protein
MLKARTVGIFEYILLNLKKGVAEGLYRKDMNMEIIAKLYLDRIENTHMQDLFTKEEFTSIKLFVELLTYHIRGIATEKGIQVLEKKIKEIETAFNN